MGVVRRRRGSGAEAVPLVRILARDFEHFLVGVLAMGSYYTYVDGRIAGEVGQCDMQSPVVLDRSALAALHGES